MDDATRKNSAMKVISGSHQCGHLDFTLVKDREVVLSQEFFDAERYGEAEYFELQAGQISLHLICLFTVQMQTYLHIADVESQSDTHLSTYVA